MVAGRSPPEVTETGEVVWELINRCDKQRLAVMTQATRYPLSYFEVEDWTCSRGADGEGGLK